MATKWRLPGRNCLVERGGATNCISPELTVMEWPSVLHQVRRPGCPPSDRRILHLVLHKTSVPVRISPTIDLSSSDLATPAPTGMIRSDSSQHTARHQISRPNVDLRRRILRSRRYNSSAAWPVYEYSGVSTTGTTHAQPGGPISHTQNATSFPPSNLSAGRRDPSTASPSI